MTSSSWPEVAHSPDLRTKVGAANVLMVGAGGIGCELIKTLVLSGFRKITMVDMDTIEISNLNRQFLFRKRHVGMSKAQVAAEAVKAFCPDADITTMQDNVKDSKFDIAFMKTFDIVLNGLDNIEARRHVNRLCLAADVPLVESGTTGYKGQVTVHLKGESDCFDCEPRAPPKGFPICTIRNTPDKPIHCIVWAKDLLFQRLFGPPEVVTDLDEQEAATDGTVSDDAAKEADAGAPAASEFLRGEGESAWAYAQRVFTLVYNRDLLRLQKIEKLWEARAPPTALPAADEILAGVSEPADCPADGVLAFLGLNPRSEWSVEETARAFMTSIYVFHQHRAADVGSAAFTKDDDLAVTFVAAAANLRAHCFGIPTQSEFEAKGMAGNIIHAIATTNAIIAGYIVIEALKVLSASRAACRMTFLSGTVPNQYGKLAVPSHLPQPNPSCTECGRAIAVLTADTTTFTLQQLVTDVLKRRLAFKAPTITLENFMYEEGDDLSDDEVEENAAHLPTALAALPGGGIQHSTWLTVSDSEQNMQATLVVQHEAQAGGAGEPFVLTGDVPVAKADAPAEEAAAAEEPVQLGKRKADGDADAGPAAKKHREDDAGVIDLDSDSDGGGAGPSTAADVIALD